MDLDFDDALSEDWISQPGSSGPSSVRDESFASSTREVSAVSSRIPRRESREGAKGFLESRRTGSVRQQSALNEKRPSQLNANITNTGTRLSKGSFLEDDSLSSTRSSQSVRRGTVLQNDKPHSTKAKDRATPEWKRRLLAGRAESSQQTDLFSPIGLENVFAAPEAASDTSVAGASKAKSLPEPPKPVSPKIAMKKASHDGKTPVRGAPQTKSTERDNSQPRKSHIPSPRTSPVHAKRPRPGSQLPQKKNAMPDVDSLAEQLLSSTISNSAPHEDVLHATDELRSLVDHQGSMSPDSLSLLDDSPTETQPFVTFTRGNDHSNVSSLERFSDLSQPMLSELSQLVQDEEPTEQRPETPKAGGSPARSGGSPLKLFGKYDTFTNDRLARRINQFEDGDGNEGTSQDAASDRQSFDAGINVMKRLDTSQGRGKLRAVSNFGVGELDQFTFAHEDMSEIDIDTAVPRYVGSRHSSGVRTASRVVSLPVSAGSFDPDAAIEPIDELLDFTNEEGKRLPDSPRKIPEAKRRRTSLPLSLSDDGTIEQPTAQYREAEKYTAGMKRKDARYDNNYPTASPEVIALRQILQPRVPYGPGRRSVSIAKSGAIIATDGESSNALALIPIADASADSLILNDASDLGEGVRKKSVTTADFFKEANLIMRNIRAQAQSPVLHQRELTEDGGSPDQSFLPYNEEFTMEQLSRPASREGSYRQRPQRVLNARVVSHLRKYKEKDDTNLVLTSSLVSVPRNDESLHSLSEEIHSDPPNIRIRQRPLNTDLRRPAVEDDGEDQIDSQSSGHGTDVSLPTGSSGGSSAPRATISPDKVSHLLSRTMGGMTFDEFKGCWVKTRLLGHERPSLGAAAESELNDDDPFEAIPDLTIDESQEVMAVRGVIRRTSSKRSAQPVLPAPKMSIAPPLTTDAKPASSGEDLSSVISKYTRFASSEPVAETRATSWGDAALRRSKSEFDAQKMGVRTIANTQQRLDHEVPSTLQATQEQLADISVASRYSSPTKEPEAWAPSSPSAKSDGEVDYDGLASNAPDRPAFASRRHVCELSRITSRSTQELSRFNESFNPSESQLMPVPDDDDMQVAVSTPRIDSRFNGTLLAPDSISHASVGGLQLTPLPDFTVHQPDESLQLDVGYVARRHGLFSREAVEGKFSLAIRDLVEKITDVEPHEPYWEFLRKLDLRKRNLMTLHMLNDFCSRVENLDISENQLGQLNGAPLSLRVLNVRNNCLSSLTAWHHLPNLQYLDVSGNGITNLKAFASLVHLRELNVESNDVEEIDGLLAMDNLISLKLGHNRISKIDFTQANWPHLTTLDVHHNQVQSILGLAQLSTLQDLNFRENRLEVFSFDQENLPRSLQHLDLSANRLERLELTDAPALKSLAVDRNKVENLEGLEALRSIETVSWSHQSSKTSGQPAMVRYECCAQVQFLNLSGILFKTFAPTTPFLNLRRLELASCGLESLGDNLGSCMPNIRVINLNDNGLKDIRPLEGIVMLEELHITRNRISRLRTTTKALEQFASTLRVLDMRENPLTHAFYPRIRPGQGLAADTSEKDTTLELAGCCPCSRSDRSLSSSLLAPNKGGDDDYQTRLDEETLMRRRVYEALVLCSCSDLETWDGMAVERRRVPDKAIWERLTALGVLKKRE